MRSFSLLDTYDPSANSTGYPYKESISMISLAINDDRPGHAPAGQAQTPGAVWSANRDGLVAAAVARCRRALLLEALAAVNRLVVPRLEGDFRLLAAGR